MSREQFADRLKSSMDRLGLKQVDLIRKAQESGIKLGKSHVSSTSAAKPCHERKSFVFFGDPASGSRMADRRRSHS